MNVEALESLFFLVVFVIKAVRVRVAGVLITLPCLTPGFDSKDKSQQPNDWPKEHDTIVRRTTMSHEHELKRQHQYEDTRVAALIANCIHELDHIYKGHEDCSLTINVIRPL
jgi:hypothetical protein